MEHSGDDSTDEQLLVELLNNSALTNETSQKVECVHKIQEILLRKSPNLLPKFLSDVLNFTTDKNGEVKKALIGFIEELCKLRETFLPKVMVNLLMLICDDSIVVQKRVIQAAITIYRITLQWLCKSSTTTDEMVDTWNQLTTIKLKIATLIDSDNDGIRTSAVKFVECVILLQTYPDETENRKANDFSLDDVPLTLKIARRRKLEEEANNFFDVLLKFHNSQHISGANLLTCLGVLTNLAKTRAEFMSKVITAILELYHNFPPTLSTTQVNSVKKKLKTELSNLVRHPAGYEFLDKISPILLELGCSQSEINKMVPKADERRKYSKRTLHHAESGHVSKKIRLDHHHEKREKKSDKHSEKSQKIEKTKSPHELNEEFVQENLSLEKAIHLVTTNLLKLPNSMPSTFAKEYQKFVDGEMVGNTDIIATLLAFQFLEAKVGPGGLILKERDEKEKEKEEAKKREREEDKEDERVAKKEKLKSHKIKTLKLAEITKPLDKNLKEKLLVQSVERLLQCEQVSVKKLKQKVVTVLAAGFSPIVKESILTFILQDIRGQMDIVLAWLFEEYSIMQGFCRKPPLRKDVKLDQAYNNLISTFVSASSNDPGVLCRILLEAPLITDEALDQIKIICRDENRCQWALKLLRDLTLRKPPKQLTFLNVLLVFTTYENNVVRDCALRYVLELHQKMELKIIIEEFARMNLEFLKLKRPPESLCGFNQGRLKSESWGDDFIKACLLPFISLLPSDQHLIHDLAGIYVQTSADIKRIILRLLETPIRSMGMESFELLKLVETCPKGSETLVTRVIHILTDKEPPSAKLVQIVRDLYNSRVSDVRFLIPVLNGLSKKEVLSALPKLVKLNPVVVKEVFNRLLGLHGDSPVSPTELMVALHIIDPSKADLKMIIKATSMCLQEKHVFTQEVMAVVLQQLMEQTPLPTLLMRTVIQALGSYPRLSGFVMNILQRLILKQVWKQKVVWEGFIKCCQRTKPQSFAVLLQLPAPQLMEALNICGDLREPLREHLMSLSEQQRGHIPSAVTEVVLGPYQPPPVMVPMPAPVPDPGLMMGGPPIMGMPEQMQMAPPQSMDLEPLPPGMD